MSCLVAMICILPFSVGNLCDKVTMQEHIGLGSGHSQSLLDRLHKLVRAIGLCLLVFPPLWWMDWVLDCQGSAKFWTPTYLWVKDLIKDLHNLHGFNGSYSVIFSCNSVWQGDNTRSTLDQVQAIVNLYKALPCGFLPSLMGGLGLRFSWVC